MGAPEGNRNALKGKHGRRLFGISGPELDYLYEELERRGNFNPTHDDLKEAILFAIRKVYGTESEQHEQ